MREKIRKQKKSGTRVLALFLAVFTAVSMNVTGWAASKELVQNDADGATQKDHVVFAASRDGVAGISANGSDVSCDAYVKYEGEDGSLKITAGRADNSIFLDSFDFTGYNFVEFYVYTKAGNTQAGTWWGNDTSLQPGKWTLVRLDLQHEYLTLINDQGQEFCPNKWHKDSPFVGRLVLRFMGSGCKAGTEFWISSVKAYSTRSANSVATVETAGYASSNAKAEYVTDKVYDDESYTADNLMKAAEKGLLKVTVTGDEASVGIWSAQMNNVSMAEQVYFYVYTDARNTKAGGWWCGDTPLTPGKWTKVTLTKEMKPQNWNGKDIFDREIGPRAFAYRFMGGSDGTVFYVTSLYADMPFAKEPVEIIANHCTTDKESYLRGDMVTLKADPAPEGKIFDYYTVNGVYAGRNGFVAADKQSVVDVVYRDAHVIQSANKAGASGIDGNDSAISYDSKRSYGYENGAIKVRTEKEDNAIYLDRFDFTGYNFVEFYVYTDADNTQAGTWWGNDTNLEPGKWTLVRLDLQHENITLISDQGQEFCPNKWQKGSPFVGRLVLRFMGNGCKEGTEFWISSVKAYSTRSANSVATVETAGYASSNAKAEYVTDKAYDDESYTADNLVKATEEGLLKVTVTGGEAAVGIWSALLNDVSMAKQVYFYVYTDAGNTKAGGWWCGDTPLTPGEWTKVTLTKEMKPQNWNGKDIFDREIGPRAFTYRFMGGGDGTVFFVTSLYADMPFAKEPVKIITNHCTTDKESYLRGDMVTLKADSAPEGKTFDYYTVNGVYAGRNGFVVADKQSVVDVVYRDAHVIQSANKAGVSGIDGNGSIVSYDTKRAYANESGSIKVTAGSSDNAIYLDRFDFTGYSLYRIFDLESAQGSAYSYTVNDTWKAFADTADAKAYVNADTQGYVTWVGEKTAERTAAFAKLALNYAKENSIAADKSGTLASDAPEGATLVFENLPLGYYLVDSTMGTLCALDTTNKETTVREKNTEPALDKQVKEDSAGSWGDVADADRGQRVDFKVTITAQEGAQNYKMHDKMDIGLEFISDSVKVQIQRAGAADITDVEETGNYSMRTEIGTGEGCTFHVTFTQAFCDTLKANDKIIVSYSAKVKAEAWSIDYGKNTAYLEYGENGGFTTEPKTVKVNTWQIPVYKYFMDGTEKKGLAGAVFTLSKNEDGSNPIEFVVGEAVGGTPLYRVAFEGTALDQIVTEITTTADGNFILRGLDADTYYLTEKTAPTGYNKLSGPVKITIDNAGKVSKENVAVETVEIENKTGALLPDTGGIGTTIFYIAGGILVVGAVVLLVTRKCMSVEK